MQINHLTLINDISELDKIVIRLEELAGAWQIPDKYVMEINLALEELFTNIVFYAYDDGLQHEIHIEFSLTTPEVIQIQLIDEGKPFNLLEKDTSGITEQSLEERPIGGLGIHFVKEIMNSVEYQRFENKNIVSLIKKFSN